jgi:hypothetical protein
MAYLIYPVAAIVGFVALFFGATLVAGEIAGTMPYEDALPILLGAGVVGAAIGILFARKLLRPRVHSDSASSAGR